MPFIHTYDSNVPIKVKCKLHPPNRGGSTTVMQLTLLLVCHLVADGLGAAPLQKDLFDTAGAGHSKALRTLQGGLGVDRLGTTGGREEMGQYTITQSCLGLRNERMRE